MRILITGGLGYVGSHTVVEVLAAGHQVHVVDNLGSAGMAVHSAIERLTGRECGFTLADIRDAAAMEALIAAFAPEAVIHFAALKAVGESVVRPLEYFDNNVAGTITLLKALQPSACRCFVFSSSATVYGEPAYLPIDEDHPLRVTNPYGRTKLQVEGILEDLARSDPRWSIALLRYFNPVGAHASELMGEDPAGVPDNLLPYIAQVAIGRRPRLTVYGDDYDTADGTGVRDYVHVSDVAEAHLAALQWTAGPVANGCEPFNIGTGQGTSVLEMIHAFSGASGRDIPHVIAPRRPGDVASCYAAAGKAARILGWQAERNVSDMCQSAWHWQRRNPDGYPRAAGTEGASGRVTQ